MYKMYYIVGVGEIRGCIGYIGVSCTHVRTDGTSRRTRWRTRGYDSGGGLCVYEHYSLYDFFHFSVHTNETTILINFMSTHDDS